MAEFNLLGMNVQINKQNKNPNDHSAASRVRDSLELLRKCRDGHAQIDAEIVANEVWYRSRHWEFMRTRNATAPEPVTAYLFNVLINKHADAMDNYPRPNFLPSEKDDVEESKRLSAVVPAILEKNRYKNVYSESWWYKLKHGFVIRGSFWDANKQGGLGDIRHSYIDKLNCTWTVGAKSADQIRDLFVYDEEDTKYLQELYPDLKIDGQKVVQPLRYIDNPEKEDADTTLIVEHYRIRTGPDGIPLLHYSKLIGENEVYNSEEDEENPDFAVKGFYHHGRLPVVFDVLFPLEGTPIGFGFIAIGKSPQLYIDKLDQIICDNSMMAGKKRWFRRRDGNINMEQFANWNETFVDVTGPIDEEHLREINVSPLNPFISQHRQNKVQEMKDITANDVFNSGNGGKGVTAASAIYALQEAGNKVSRDMIATSYEAFRDEMFLTVELIRQQYNVTRSFRIDQENGQYDFMEYSNENLQPQMYGESEMMGQQFRVPEFDIKISAEKKSPYSTLAENERAISMFGAGFFNPQMAEQADIALDMMTFEGKDAIREKIHQNSALMQQMQQMQQALVKLAGATGMLQPPGGAPMPGAGATEQAVKTTRRIDDGQR